MFFIKVKKKHVFYVFLFENQCFYHLWLAAHSYLYIRELSQRAAFRVVRPRVVYSARIAGGFGEVELPLYLIGATP